MARRSILAAAIDRREPEVSRSEPSTNEAIRPAARRNPNAGKYHLGGYFATDDPTAEAFRMLAAKTRRSHQELLGEAIADLVDKYDSATKFAR